jgi:hypothetical protein
LTDSFGDMIAGRIVLGERADVNGQVERRGGCYLNIMIFRDTLVLPLLSLMK